MIWERGLYRKGTGEGTSPLRQPNFGRLISLNRDLEKISIALTVRSVDLLPMRVCGGGFDERLPELAIQQEQYWGVEARRNGEKQGISIALIIQSLDG